MSGTLNSPGVSVQLTDESIYASATGSTTPLFIVGSHDYKTQPDGVTLAQGTIPANANTLYTITSQRDLCQTFGNPVFYTSEGTPQNGYELNEYGLHAAYQYLAISNSVYVIRGALDYSQLNATTTSPRGQPIGGTYWLNTVATKWGIFQSNGAVASTAAAWQLQTPIVLQESSDIQYAIIGSYSSTAGSEDPTTTVMTVNGSLVINGLSINLPAGTPLLADTGEESVVSIINSATGDNTAYIVGQGGLAYIMLIDSSNVGYINLEGSNAQTLIDLGLTYSELTNGQATIIAASLYPNISIGATSSYAINTIYNSNAMFQKLQSFYKIAGTNVESIPVWYQLGTPMWQRASPNTNGVTFAPSYQAPLNSKNGDVWINTSNAYNGVNFVIESYNAATSTWITMPAPLFTSSSLATSGIGVSSLVLNSSVFVQVPDTNPANATIVDPSTGNTIANPNYITVCGAYMTPFIWSGTDWSLLVYQSQGDAPTTPPEDGTYWYNNNFQVDIMISNGQKWLGYQNFTGFSETDPNGPILDASPPSVQSDGSPLVSNDLWVNTSLSTLESYPQIYRFASSTKTWQLINNADNVSSNGIIFADARWNVNGTANGNQASSSMVISDYVDPDAPDPLLYPYGLLLWNTRLSTMNVKQWQSTQLSGLYEGTDYTQNAYNVGIANFPAVPYAGRWVTASGNAENGTPYMGRKAQRIIVIESLRASINEDNDNLLSEAFFFNLIACPGYTELISDMNELARSKKQVAFVVGDTPARLASDGTSLTNWATNAANATEDGDAALITASPYISVFYPWGLTTNVDGNTVFVPPSTMAMSTIAYNDSIAYVWSTPAGYTRGLVTNATSVGYISATTGNYVPTILNNGQRDVLYQNNICAIAYMPRAGLCIMGDKTLDSIAEATNRINVARLACYLNYNLDIIARPFLFEPNIQHTRDTVTAVMNGFLSNLVTLNALYDYIVVCDTTNNTPTTIDANELWIDIAIQPVKTIDFIYIPIRIESTGTNLNTVFSGTSGTASSSS
jgi:hypothetical protein